MNPGGRGDDESGAARGDDARLQQLLRLNAALDAQVRQLVRAEQKLFLSQRDLSRQLARLDALNGFALEVSGLDRPDAILDRAADVLFSLFPFDQYAGFVRDGELGFEIAAVRAVPGREAPADSPRERVPDAVLGTEALTGPACELRDDAGLAPLIAATDRLFASGDPESDASVWTLVLPVPGRAPEDAVAALVFRRLPGPLSFHDELPSEKDRAFLGLFAKQIAASLTTAQLVRDLRASYARLDEAQRERVHRERLAALGELSAVVAHEVRNPLGAIFNAVSVLGKLVPGEGDAATMVGIVREESHRLNQIVSDLLDFARPHEPATRPEALWGLIESAMTTVKVRFPSARIEARDDAPGIQVLADPRMVRQAIINLLLNAMHAAPEGTSVDARLTVGAHGMACVEIADRGPGVPVSLVERVFEPFFTTRPSGTGLGLAVVRRVAESHRGTVEMREREGGGAVFVLCLPVDPKTA